jgi:hypothetical protein
MVAAGLQADPSFVMTARHRDFPPLATRTLEGSTAIASGPLAASANSIGATSVAASDGSLLKRREAARVLGVSESTVRRMEGTVLTPVQGRPTG